MDSKSDSDIVSSVRDMAISRRGGVRTRGGRLPPIRMREITQVTGSKKTIAPNIPQRRKVIKQEVDMSTTKQVYKFEQRDESRGARRGRQSKAFLQTEGSFLAEGPAAKIKKNPLEYESYSIPRISRKATSEDCQEFDADTIKDILESYEENEAYEDVFGERPPYRLPLLKENLMSKIKTEPPDDYIKPEINIKKEIKTENEDEESSCTKEKNFPKLEFTPKTEVKNPAEQFQNVKGNGTMVLFQLPRHSITTETETSEASSKDKKQNKDEMEQISTVLENLEEGLVGKLQIMKSGRMKIILGSSEFELLDGIPSESYWEAVSIQIRDDGGDLAVLGKIDRKIMLSPVMERLIPNDQSIGFKN